MKKKKQKDDIIPYTKQLKLLRQEKEFWQRFNIMDPEDAPEHVNHLDLRCSGITDDQLALLVKRVRSVEMFDLNDTDITNEGLAHLTKMEYLAELRLKDCMNIDNGCIPYLNQIKMLKFLYVKSTPVTVDGLLHLNTLPHLEKLFFGSHGLDITDEQKEQLFTNLPCVELIIDGTTYKRQDPGLK